MDNINLDLKLIEENTKLKNRINRRERIASELRRVKQENRDLKKTIELLTLKLSKSC